MKSITIKGSKRESVGKVATKPYAMLAVFPVYCMEEASPFTLPHRNLISAN